MKKKKSIKKRIAIKQILILSILIILASLVYKYVNKGNINVEAKENRSIVKQTIVQDIEENDDVLINPGKGFTYTGDLYGNYNDIVAVGYYRYNWADIETKEGVYNWTLIDEKIEEYASAGKQFSFGVMCANSSAGVQYVTPKWVFDAGAKGRDVDVTFWYTNSTVKQTIPIWTDKVFLEKLNNFIKALAQRYDNNSNIAYIDIRSYGNWGEQHLGEIGGKNITAEQLKELYIKPYMKYFKNTLLINPWGSELYNSTYQWAIENGISIRRDGIFQYSDGSECSMAYGKLPTIFEYTEKYSWLKENNLWSQAKLLEYIENGKPSYIQFDTEMYKENKEYCEMLANKIGYYFKLKQAQYTNAVTKDEDATIVLKFVNEGVTPLYEDAYVYIGLLDENNNLVKKYITNVNPQEWQPNEKVTEEIKIKLNDVQNGSYNIAVGLFVGKNDKNPTYLLGNEGKTENNWYIFGKINICNEEQIIDNLTSNQENTNIRNEEQIIDNMASNQENTNKSSDKEQEESRVTNEKESQENSKNENEKSIEKNGSKEETSNAEDISNEVKNTEKINGIETELNLYSSLIVEKSKIVITVFIIVIILLILVAVFLLIFLLIFLYKRYFKKSRKK